MQRSAMTFSPAEIEMHSGNVAVRRVTFCAVHRPGHDVSSERHPMIAVAPIKPLPRDVDAEISTSCEFSAAGASMRGTLARRR